MSSHDTGHWPEPKDKTHKPQRREVKVAHGWSPRWKRPPRMHPDDFDPNERAFPFLDHGPSLEVLMQDDPVMDACLQHEDMGPKHRERLSYGPPFIRVDSRSVIFIMQTGPINEVGTNGCQIDDMLRFNLMTLQTLNKKFPCRENSLAITKLQECLMWLEERRLNRSRRGVEGYNEE